MIREMWRVQWHWARTPMVLFTLCAVAIPLAVFGAASAAPFLSAQNTLAQGQMVVTLWAILACATGVVIAIATWHADRNNGYSYAFSLPIRRDSYMWWRVTFGLGLLTLPAVAIAIGTWIATARLRLAPGLQIYTLRAAAFSFAAMALWFCLTIFVVRGLSARGRRWLIACLLLLLLITAAESVMMPVAQPGPVTRVIVLLFTGKASPFAVLFPSWRVVDL